MTADDPLTPRQAGVAFGVAAVVLAGAGLLAADAVSAAGLLGAPGLWLVVAVVALARPRTAAGVLVLGVLAVAGSVVGASDEQVRGFAGLALVLVAGGGSVAWAAGAAVHVLVGRARRARRDT